ncbi:MAG: GTP 3',8-cyclase MoaA [Bacteroidota bacterium]
MLYDNHGRPLDYLRLSVTDRCNLRCFYCMPAEGINYLPRKELLTYEEMLRLVDVLVQMGIKKIRITGGEPFVRRNLIDFMWSLSEIEGLEEINITTNGVLTGKYIDQMKAMGVNAVNLSIDSLDRERFHHITRRDELPKVLETFHQLMDNNIKTKLNAVVMAGKNHEDLIPLAELTRKYPVGVRFIEEMPFNGNGANYEQLHWNHRRILEELRNEYPDLEKVPDGPNSTSYNYKVPGHQGKIGIIAAFTRTFCGTCNRIRMTAKGMLKTCLYDDGVLDIKKVMRDGATDEKLKEAFLSAFNTRAKDGYEAERNRKKSKKVTESMATIGG